jgi:octaprenyl-diphosphate synthase
LDEIAHLLREDLDQVEVEIKKRLISQVPSVTQIAQHIVLSGGKRIRPILLLLAAKALNYHGPRVSYYGAAVEFIHTATLLHDDVIDHAQLRRGRPSCNSIWDNKMSVLVGDFLYCQVSSMIAEDGDLRVLKCVTDATASTTEGEVFEVIKSRDLELTEAEYYKIIEFKTGMLMSCATEVGAILGNATASVQTRMRDFGMNLGIAFQLADDVLDYTSVEAEFGKEKGVDLKEGKITLPLLHALERCDPKEKEIIREGTITANPDTFFKVLDVLKKYGSLDYTMHLAQARVRKTQELLGGLPDSPYKEGLLRITEYVTQRRK